MSQVSNKFLTPMPSLTIKGNDTVSTAQPKNLTVAQVNAILPIFTSVLNGLVPFSGGGTSTFLRADGTWTGIPSLTVTQVSTNASFFPVFVASSSTGTQAIDVGTGLSFNPSTNVLTTTTFSGALTGTASGNTTYTPNNHGVVLSSATNAMTVLAPNASTAFPLVSGGASADPSWALLTIAGGGTGAATKAAAFDALSPMTTGGDIIYGGASGTGTRLANGSSGQFLMSNGGTSAPSWAAPSVSSVTTTAVTTNASFFPLFVASSSNSSQAVDLGAGLTFNPSTNIISTTGLNLSGLTASQAVVTDSSKNLASLSYASANTASALVQRDGSGNFSAGTITAALTGTASQNPLSAISSITTTATIAATASFINADASGGAYTATFPVPTGNTNKSFLLRKTSSDFTTITLAIATSGNFVENGSSTATTRVDTIGESVEFMSDGTNYIVTRRVIPSYWQSYTTTLTGITIGNGSKTAFWRRVGDSIEGNVGFNAGATTSYTGAFSTSIPSGITINTSLIDGSEAGIGSVLGTPDGISTYTGSVTADSTTITAFYGPVTTAAWNATTPGVWGTSGQFSCRFLAPITGWKG